MAFCPTILPARVRWRRSLANPAHSSLSMDGQPQPSARAAIDIIAVTSYDDFLVELGQALGGPASVTPVASMSEALESLGHSGRVQVLMIDSRGLTDLPAEINTLQAQAT